MAFSNKFGWIALSTGNKSEMSVGYATLYGDMAGGFAVIKDVPKTLVYRICRHVNETEGREIVPDSLLTQEPPAEPRPGPRAVDPPPPYQGPDPLLAFLFEGGKGVGEIVTSRYDR